MTAAEAAQREPGPPAAGASHLLNKSAMATAEEVNGVEGAGMLVRTVIVVSNGKTMAAWAERLVALASSRLLTRSSMEAAVALNGMAAVKTAAGSLYFEKEGRMETVERKDAAPTSSHFQKWVPFAAAARAAEREAAVGSRWLKRSPMDTSLSLLKGIGAEAISALPFYFLKGGPMAAAERKDAASVGAAMHLH